MEDVWDEFNHGVASPWAVRDFLAWAHRKWRPRPRFVVLAGSGSLDPRDNLGHGGNLLTPVLVTTPYGLAASDQALAELAGDDGVPEVAIGRIPALTNDELQAYVDKLIAVESARGPWRRKVVLLVDNPDGAGDFPAYSDAVARLLPRTFSRQKIYLSGGGARGARPRLEQRRRLGQLRRPRRLGSASRKKPCLPRPRNVAAQDRWRRGDAASTTNMLDMRYCVEVEGHVILRNISCSAG